MKKVLLSLIVFLYALSVQAQGFRVGMSGGINSTWLMNKNVFDANDELDIASSFGGRVGFDAIYSFNDKIGLSLGLNFLSSHNQKYTGEYNNGSVTYDAKIKLRYFDIPLLFRLTSANGPYFEIGPQFGILTKATEDFEMSPAGSWNYTNRDRNNDINFNKLNVGLILGFGVDIDVTDNLYITTGLRLGYGFSDVTKEHSESEIEIYEDLEQLSGPTYWAHYTDADTGNNDTFSYEKTSRVFGGLHIGVSYKFGGE